MKTIQYNFLLVAFICAITTSCVKQDDEIFINASNENSVTNEEKGAYSTIELEILDLINSYRATKGLKQIERLNIISTIALSHTNYMVETGIVDHFDFPIRQNNLINNYGAKAVAEIVGSGFNTSKEIVDAWLNRSEHKALLETPNFKNFGISLKKNSTGKNYFTVIFIK